MNKAIIMVAVAAYILGVGIYFITYVAGHWGDPSYLSYVVGQAFTGGLMWPFLIYAWLRFDTPIM